MAPVVTAQASRSAFVTVLAWLVIVFAGFAAFVTLLQNILLNVAFPLQEMQAAVEKAPPELPWFSKMMIKYMREVVAGFLAFWIFVLVSAIALLKRKNWARLTFIVLLALGIVVNVGSLFYVTQMFDQMSNLPDNAPVDVRAQFETFNQIILGGIAVLGLGFSVLHAWLIWKLRSSPIVAEFRGQLAP